jgi:hypothetical protein
MRVQTLHSWPGAIQLYSFLEYLLSKRTPSTTVQPARLAPYPGVISPHGSGIHAGTDTSGSGTIELELQYNIANWSNNVIVTTFSAFHSEAVLDGVGYGTWGSWILEEKTRCTGGEQTSIISTSKPLTFMKDRTHVIGTLHVALSPSAFQRI